MGYWMGVLRSRGVSGIWGGVGGFFSWFAGRGVGGRVDEWLTGWGSRYARGGVGGRLVFSGWADSEYLGWWRSRWAYGRASGRIVELVGG